MSYVAAEALLNVGVMIALGLLVVILVSMLPEYSDDGDDG